MPGLEIRIINLSTSKDRRLNVLKNFDSTSYDWAFYEALTTVASNYPYRAGAARVNKGRELTDAERAVFNSHCSCMQEFILESKSKIRLIAEDDMFFDLGFPFELLPDFMSVHGIDYLRLYSQTVPASVCLGRWRHRSLLRFEGSPLGMQAYAISKNGAKRFLKAISETTRPIDQEIDRYWSNNLPPYAIFPYPVIELHGRSTIFDKYHTVNDRSTSELLRRAHGRVVDDLMRAMANITLRLRDRAIREKNSSWNNR